VASSSSFRLPASGLPTCGVAAPFRFSAAVAPERLHSIVRWKPGPGDVPVNKSAAISCQPSALSKIAANMRREAGNWQLGSELFTLSVISSQQNRQALRANGDTREPTAYSE
jgi:hypothetical protein